MEIGTHSNFHNLAYEQRRFEFRKDLQDSIFNIEDAILGKK